ncbi:MAG: PPC domain-containing protein [Bryobacteraceae bacterium]
MKLLCAGALLATAALLPAQTSKSCSVSDVSIGSPVTAALEDGDCKLSDVLPGSAAASAKAYKLTVGERQTVTIEMTSSVFDTYLALIPGEHEGMYGVNDDSPDIGTNSRIVANLAPGTYRILASGSQSGAAGQFSLKVTPEGARTCSARSLPLGETLELALSAESCRELDISSTQASVSPSAVNLFEANLPSAGILTLEVKGGSRPPEVRVEGGTFPVEPFRSRSRVSVSLPAGSYRVVVSSNLYLSYTLKSRFEATRPCAAGSLGRSTKVSGSLSEDDCRFQDFRQFTADSSYVDAYRVEVAERGVMRFRMDSGAFDTFLALLDDRGRLLAVNDDASQDDTNSEIVVHLAPGAYSLLANSAAVATGNYELQTSFESPRPCPARDLSAQGTADVTLAPAGGCRALDAELLGQATQSAVAYKLESKGGLAKVALSAFGGDASFDVVDAAGRQVAHANTDRFGLASVETRLREGSYRLVLYSLTTDPNPVSVKVTTSPAKACASVDLALGVKASAQLGGADCRVLDAMLESQETALAKSFRIDVGVAGRLDLDLNSGEFEPTMLLLDRNDNVLESALRREPSAIRLSANVPAGSYRVIVAGPASGGVFDLTASLAEGAQGTVANPRNEPYPKPALKRGAETGLDETGLEP